MRGDSYPNPTRPAMTAVMRGNRRVDTTPERRVRSLLHAVGYRFRKDYRIDVPGARVRPDIVFVRRRVAVFVDGCFWHRCPEHGTSPRANSHYWGPKLAHNVARDQRVDRALQVAGWTVLRIWEHVAPEDAAARIIDALVAATQGCASQAIGEERSSRYSQ
ncbi:MAG TPA: very short patch repair endonuclease [Actinomycetes bacterium]|jgi:DNA mismatch endonuclease (patch repair protein)|nr:very short patch repair endonuclease [Actinomycetes bacterium]